MCIRDRVDEQDTGNADVFIHSRPFFDGRRLHWAANRQCSGTVETQKTPVRTKRSGRSSVYEPTDPQYQGALDGEGARELAACATWATGRSARFSARRIATRPRGADSFGSEARLKS